MSVPPPDFGEPFLSWLREETEGAWAKLPAADQGWQPGTKWGTPLSDAELSDAEKFIGLRFAPDYRLFLRTLHTTTNRPKAIRYQGSEGKSVEVPGFYDWRKDREELRSALENAAASALREVEQGGLWLSEWGEKPASSADQLRVLKAKVQESSPLVPVFGHRFLVADLPEPGNPVLSIYGGDVVVYGEDLRAYLLREFSELIKPEKPAVDQPRSVRQVSSVRLWGWLVT
ncbi:MAG: hypothetical protein ACJ790_12235 [Myxococcaceae bacterium]